jgi:uncharacterized integral membrane protein
MAREPRNRTQDGHESRWQVGPRGIIGIILAIVIIIFILSNRASTRIGFITWYGQVPLWVALGLAGVGGFIAGFLLSRRHYR